VGGPAGKHLWFCCPPGFGFESGFSPKPWDAPPFYQGGRGPEKKTRFDDYYGIVKKALQHRCVRPLFEGETPAKKWPRWGAGGLGKTKKEFPRGGGCNETSFISEALPGFFQFGAFLRARLCGARRAGKSPSFSELVDEDEGRVGQFLSPVPRKNGQGGGKKALANWRTNVGDPSLCVRFAGHLNGGDSPSGGPELFFWGRWPGVYLPRGVAARGTSCDLSGEKRCTRVGGGPERGRSRAPTKPHR